MSRYVKQIIWATALLAVAVLWMTGTAFAQDPTGSAAEGQRLFEELGCRACHQLDGRGGQVGPALDNLVNSQVPLADGTTIVANEAFLRESILDPGAAVVADYPDGIMPRDFSQRLSGEQLDALVAYIANPAAAAEAPPAEAPAAAHVETEADTAVHEETGATTPARTETEARRPQEPLVPWQRDFIWVFAELHLILAAFLLGGPIFVVIAEIIGWRTGDPKYDRLAREVMRVLVFTASLVGGFGAVLTFGLVALYPDFTQYIFGRFFPLFLIYGGLIFGEIVTLYAYYYSWDALKKRKGWHIFLGVLLNLCGTLLMFGMNGLTTFMMTPPKEMVSGEAVTIWTMVFNDTFWPLNLHRLVANITLGGFLTGFYAAYRFLTARSDEERAYYDWMGFVGNFIGVATMIILPVIGFIYANELSGYDHGYLIYSMAGALSWFFEVQGILIGVLFTLALYYMWLNLQRIEGGMRFAPHMKIMFALVFIGNAVWITPHHFMATMFGQMHMEGGEIPDMLQPLALMVAKNSAVTIIILVAFIAYMLYRRAMVTVRFFSRRGIVWGSIDVRSQYALLILGYVTILTMALMGFIRSQARRDWHVYGVMPDPYTTAGQPPTWWAMTMIAVVALVAVGVIGLVMWLSTALEKEREAVPDVAPERLPRPAPGLVPRWAWLRVAGVAVILLLVLWLGGALNTVLPPSAGLLYATTGALWTLPIIFKLMYSGFIVIVALFFRMLDSPPRRPDGRVARNMVNMALIPLVATGLFIGLGQISPQIGEFRITPLEDLYREATMPAVEGRIIYFDERIGCIFCHRIGEVGGQISGRLVGPDFTTIGAERDAEYLRSAILNPSAWAAPGFEDKLGVMPEYFAQRLTPEQIDYVVAYLTALKEPESDHELSEMMMSGMPGMEMPGMEMHGGGEKPAGEHGEEATPSDDMDMGGEPAHEDEGETAPGHDHGG